jgi:PepSY-associated TM region
MRCGDCATANESRGAGAAAGLSGYRAALGDDRRKGPRNAGFWKGLRWRRGPTMSLNLHHLLGFWLALPLAMVSATGIYLGFPQQGRDLLGSIVPMTPQQRGAFATPLLREPRLDIDRARHRTRGRSRGAACGDLSSQPANRGVANSIARARHRRHDDRVGGRSRRSGATGHAANRRPDRAMDSLDPRGAAIPVRSGSRGVPLRHLPHCLRGHGPADLAAPWDQGHGTSFRCAAGRRGRVRDCGHWHDTL